jgi:hypothetical protein
MRLVLPALVVVSLACAPEPVPAGEDVFGEQQGLAACSDDVVADNPDSRCFTWRAVAGVSMGGGTAARLGFRYPELFDVVADMGGPVSDGEFFFGMLETNHLSGFCPLETLEQAIVDGKDLDDPTDASLWCGTHDEWPPRDGQQVMPGYLVNVPGSECAMFRSDFTTWYRGPKEGRGGGFGRDTLIESIADLTNIYGNILFHNEDSKYAPPGVPEDFIVPPQDKNAVAERCANPVIVEGLINREYNPTGSYNAVTFCDGESEPPAEFIEALRGRGLSEDAARDQWKGHYQPGASSRVMDFALAIDLNGNGKRDYAEPLVYNNRERWRDVGADGLSDADEPGYDASTNRDPSRDNFDTLTNPDGAEGNLRRDEGEPYDDDGLDGMPGTGDFGEGNGTYEIAPNLQRVFDRSPREYWKNMSDAQVARLDIWLDAGIRDFLNTAQNTNALYHEIQKRAPSAATYEDFPNLPGIDGQYLYLNADYSREAMGQVAYLRYGDASICPSSDSVLGDGNHVGPDVVNRLFTLFSFLSERMPMQGRNTAIGGEVSDLESPTGSLTDFAFMTSYDSEVLGKQYDYGVMLPPDYFFSEESYPVLYFFHGQGMDADGMSATGLALFGPMKESGRVDRVRDGLTDLQRAIIIWVDGECPPDVCWTGNFYADFEGLPRDDRRYEQALYELMKHVEQEYRVKKPEMIPLSELE